MPVVDTDAIHGFVFMREHARWRIVWGVGDGAERARYVSPVRLAIGIGFHKVVQLVAALADVVELRLAVRPAQALAIAIATARHHVQEITFVSISISSKIGHIYRGVGEGFDRST